MRKRFTAISINALQPTEKRYEIGDAEPNLWVVVQPSGAKSFVVRYKFEGKAKKLTIGPVSAVLLSDARDAAREAMKKVAVGIDPAALKVSVKAEKAKEKQTASKNLIINVFDDYTIRHVSQKKSGHEIIRVFKREVLPKWGDRRVEQIERGDVIALLDGIVNRGAPYMANRTLAHLRKFFNWARARDYKGLMNNPCDGVMPAAKEVKRDRILTDVELAVLLKATFKMEKPWGEFFRLLIYTGVRRDEAASCSWKELHKLSDAQPEWIIPATRTKNGRAHILPLPQQVVDLLKRIDPVKDCEYVFTVTGKTALAGFSDAKERLEKHMSVLMEESNHGSILEPWRIHDIRRTVATGMAGLGIAPHIVESVLNHVSGAMAGVAGVYNRHGYYAEKKHALTVWQAHLEGLSNANPTSTTAQIIPIRQ